MNLSFTPSAWDDYQWHVTHDRKLLRRVNQLIQETLRSPIEGIGKPESLRGDLSGYWSRRINDIHRLGYGVKGEELVVIACQYFFER